MKYVTATSSVRRSSPAFVPAPSVPPSSIIKLNSVDNDPVSGAKPPLTTEILADNPVPFVFELSTTTTSPISYPEPISPTIISLIVPLVNWSIPIRPLSPLDAVIVRESVVEKYWLDEAILNPVSIEIILPVRLTSSLSGSGDVMS